MLESYFCQPGWVLQIGSGIQYVQMCICMNVHRIYVCMHVYVCICMYVCVYTCIHDLFLCYFLSRLRITHTLCNYQVTTVYLLSVHLNLGTILQKKEANPVFF